MVLNRELLEDCLFSAVCQHATLTREPLHYGAYERIVQVFFAKAIQNELGKECLVTCEWTEFGILNYKNSKKIDHDLDRNSIFDIVVFPDGENIGGVIELKTNSRNQYDISKLKLLKSRMNCEAVKFYSCIAMTTDDKSGGGRASGLGWDDLKYVIAEAVEI